MTGHDDTALLKALGCLVFGGSLAYLIFSPPTTPAAAPALQVEQVPASAPGRNEAPALPSNGSAVLVTHSVLGTSVSSGYIPSPPQPEYVPTPLPVYAGEAGAGEPPRAGEGGAAVLRSGHEGDDNRAAGVFVGVAATHALRGELRAGRQFERAEQRAARFENHMQQREMRAEHREVRVERPALPVHVGGASVGYHQAGGGRRR